MPVVRLRRLEKSVVGNICLAFVIPISSKLLGLALEFLEHISLDVIVTSFVLLDHALDDLHPLLSKLILPLDCTHIVPDQPDALVR